MCADEAACALAIIKSDASTSGTCKLEITIHFQGRDDQVCNSTTFALEDLAVSSRELQNGCSAEDELVDRVIDEGVFQSSAKVAEAGFLTLNRCVARIEIHETVFGRYERESVGKRIFDLKRINLNVTTHR